MICEWCFFPGVGISKNVWPHTKAFLSEQTGKHPQKTQDKMRFMNLQCQRIYYRRVSIVSARNNGTENGKEKYLWKEHRNRLEFNERIIYWIYTQCLSENKRKKEQRGETEREREDENGSSVGAPHNRFIRCRKHQPKQKSYYGIKAMEYEKMKITWFGIESNCSCCHG